MIDKDKRGALQAQQRRKRRKRRCHRNRVLLILVLVVIAIIGIGSCARSKTVGGQTKSKQESSDKENKNISKDTKKDTDKKQKTDENKETKAEKKIYTYLQGVKSYESGKKWSGKWCYEEASGMQFSSFGCGICSIANVVSTKSAARIEPLEVYQTAQEVSSYRPGDGVGAIGWSDMLHTLNHYGVDGQLKEKPATYEEFQEDMRMHSTMIALISSDNSDAYWKDTPGHYVSLWLYNPDTDEVFLGDSAKPSYNRKWISLKTVYEALKTESSSQYLAVVDSDSV